MEQDKLLIWDFDGVICDSLIECITVTRLAAFILENPDVEITQSGILNICNPEAIRDLYSNLKRLRPFIVKGQDYLWQLYNLDKFDGVDSGFEKYIEIYNTIYNQALDEIYEKAFYNARMLLSDYLGEKYFSLFKAYPGSLYAFRYARNKFNTYICTARDQKGVQVLLEGNSISFPREHIYSKDYNGLEMNNGQSKTEQIITILNKEKHINNPFILIEDQVKIPAELCERQVKVKTIWASYGYGHENDWNKFPDNEVTIVSHPSQLIFNLLN